MSNTDNIYDSVQYVCELIRLYLANHSEEELKRTERVILSDFTEQCLDATAVRLFTHALDATNEYICGHDDALLSDRTFKDAIEDDTVKEDKHPASFILERMQDWMDGIFAFDKDSVLDALHAGKGISVRDSVLTIMTAWRFNCKTYADITQAMDAIGM